MFRATGHPCLRVASVASGLTVAKEPVYGGAWPRIRRTILDRDGHVCQVRGPRCTGKATCVDHIVAASKGGEWWDPANLRASCRWCNNWLAHPPRQAGPPPSRQW